MNTFAAVDIGSNTIRLLVMEMDEQGNFREVASERVICRLGEGIHTDQRLLAHRIDLAVDILKGFQERCAPFGDLPVQVVATSAVREAQNRDEFIDRVRHDLGWNVEVIPWKEEARLTLEGVFWKLPETDQTLVTFDIGGGSTEFILSTGRNVGGIAGTALGVVRLTERFITKHPVDTGEYQSLHRHLQTELETVRQQLGNPKPELLIGTAGTVTTLAAMDQDIFPYDPERVHGTRLPRSTIERLNDDLKSKSIAERRNIRTLEKGREDLIIAGTAIVLETMRALDCDILTVSEYSLREGILLKAFGGNSSDK